MNKPRAIVPWVLVLLGLSGWQPAIAQWDFLTVTGSGGVPLNVVTAGSSDDPAIVFIHGIGQSHYSFVHQLNSDLAADHFLVAFDLRGHGASGKPWLAEDYGPGKVWADDVAAVMAATGVHRPVIVAWSYGSNVLMDYIREYGTKGLAGINLTGALGALKPFRLPKENPDTEAFLRLRKLRESPDITQHILASEGMIQWLTEAPMSASDRQIFQSIGLMLPAYARRAMMQRTINNQDLLDQLTLPVLLSLGEKDNPLQLEDGADLAGSHSQIQLSVFKNAGHSIFFERPARFNTELKKFAATVASPR
ncbi:MAG: alpha/beta fold hydrolase [Lysobacterales bacterium]